MPSKVGVVPVTARGPVARSWIVWGVSLVILMGAFLLFAYVIGWPTTPDRCVNEQCFCEYFSRADIENGVKGIRQGTNTWSNLYAIFTSLFVAWGLGRDRASGSAPNVMRSADPIADLYVFVVLFLGLGSMWFHASIAKYVSWIDGLSMYTFMAYLVFYTLNRSLVRTGVNAGTRGKIFWGGYILTAGAFAAAGAAGVDSVILILTLVVAYMVLEFRFAGFIADPRARSYWLIGIAAIVIATIFWVLSRTGGPLCDPHSFFQPHGLLWHTLAGVTATMMYLYWRRENVADGQ
ncbi:MAG: ceramidase domain-containing protein [Pseudomonadota bacterium]|uniref:ceramidase domain-containing protein n=1 Tax=Sphingomonas sp. ERG5 TaxID=1381597 RepID=UPI00190F83AD|nr:ceramidase domain-containing protein [Sphingomonas sp. ERG5]